MHDDGAGRHGRWSRPGCARGRAAIRHPAIAPYNPAGHRSIRMRRAAHGSNAEIMRKAVCCVMLLLAAPAAFAQSARGHAGHPHRLQHRAPVAGRGRGAGRRADHLDGVLDEPAWARAGAATDFVQWEPHPGEPASARTEARFLYDDRNLYVGRVVLRPATRGHHRQRAEGGLRRTGGRRFTLFLDTINDHSSGLTFAINPAGRGATRRSSTTATRTTRTGTACGTRRRGSPTRAGSPRW